MHIGQQTHQWTLPQSAALESVSADNPTRVDETGHERPPAPGVQHGRGETGASRRHCPEGQPGLTTQPCVFVLDRHGKPLQPTTPRRARLLLKAGRAVVPRHTPFVIRLKDRTATESAVAGVEVGIGPGSKHTGIAVFATEDDGVRRGLYAIQVNHRGATISKRLTARAGRRRGRRSRNLRYRAPQFLNRTKPRGWLAPSLRHRVETTITWTTRLSRWAPVTHIHVERVAFDTQLLQNPDIAGVQYQQGTLYGTEVREYLLAKWDRTCAYCGVKGVPLNLDHISPKARGGSDRVSNLTLACVPCNQTKGVRAVEEFLFGRPRTLALIRTQAKRPLRDAAAVTSTRWALWRALTAPGLPVHVATGGRTKWNRHRTGAPKTRTLDALHVGVLNSVTAWPAHVLVATSTGRGTYARTRSDAYGFPRARLPRVKAIHGFQTGDLVRAVVPTGKNVGTHIGRVAVRTTGSFNVHTSSALVQGIHYRHISILQRADGSAYVQQAEAFLPTLNGRVSNHQEMR